MASSPAPATDRHWAGCECHACHGAGAVELTADEYALEEAGRLDPTRTTTIQREYARFLRGRVGDLDAAVRTLVHEQDALRLDEAVTARWGGLSDAEKARRFDEWFQRAAQRLVLEKHDSRQVRQYFEHAARRGIRDGHADLRRFGVDVDDVEDVLEQDAVQETIALQQEDARQRVASWMNDFTTDARRLVLSGLGAGAARSVLVRDIVERGQVYKSHVSATASGRVVNTYNTTQLTAYDRVDEEIDLETEVEYVDAGDDKVCQECLDLSGQSWTLERAQQVDPIPVHNHCRCRFRVVDVHEVL